jgi:transposase
LKQTSICVVDQAGSVVREGVVDSDPEAISTYVTSKAPNASWTQRSHTPSSDSP